MGNPSMQRLFISPGLQTSLCSGRWAGKWGGSELNDQWGNWEKKQVVGTFTISSWLSLLALGHRMS